MYFIFRLKLNYDNRRLFWKTYYKCKTGAFGGIDTVINFDMKGKDAHIVVKDNAISVHEGAADGAEVSITAKESDLLSVINGDTNPMMAMMMGN